MTTKNKILDAAEQLFADQGFNGTSLREITGAAGVNLAAVNYHFGSKKELIKAVMSRYMDELSPKLEFSLFLLCQAEGEAELARSIFCFCQTSIKPI